MFQACAGEEGREQCFRCARKWWWDEAAKRIETISATTPDIVDGKCTRHRTMDVLAVASDAHAEATGSYMGFDPEAARERIDYLRLRLKCWKPSSPISEPYDSIVKSLVEAARREGDEWVTEMVKGEQRAAERAECPDLAGLTDEQAAERALHYLWAHDKCTSSYRKPLWDAVRRMMERGCKAEKP